MEKEGERYSTTRLLQNQLRWSLTAIPVALVTGSLVALFLWALDQVTNLRWQDSWLLYLLPFAGILIWWMYDYAGKRVDEGNQLVIAEINAPESGVPGRMAPLVLIATLVTHLFGGSAGREGTAVQMGGSLAAVIGRWLKLDKQDHRVLLTCGIAAGVGAVFGTPLAGTVFALEILSPGLLRFPMLEKKINLAYAALIPCIIAAFVGDMTCAAYGIRHTAYLVAVPELNETSSFIHFNWLLAGKTILAGICFGLAARIFILGKDFIKDSTTRLPGPGWLVPFTGGIILIGLTLATGTYDYLGLGVSNPTPGGVSVVSSFHAGGAAMFSWLWKLLFTIITLGMGFKGGEVTPLFFIGAALGNTIAGISGAPVDLMAAAGFIAVFAGASNAPFACIIMGLELFGGGPVVYFALACFASYFCSGRTGIYSLKSKPAAAPAVHR